MKRISNYYNEFKKYCKELKGYVHEYSILLSATIIAFLFILADYFNVLIFLHEYLVILIAIVPIIIATLFYLRIFYLIKFKTINYIDIYLNSILYGILIYFIILIIIQDYLGFTLHKAIAVSVSIVILVILIIIRLYFIQPKKKNYEVHNKNVISLNDLYNNTIPDDLDYFFINDEISDVDLLDRGYIVEQIKNSIINCNYDSTFVMAVKGKWGSGKSTILNLVKRKLDDMEYSNIIFIDEFNPWLYNDDASMLIGFFDIFSKKVMGGFQISEVTLFTKAVNNFVNFYTGHDASSLGSNIDVSKLKRMINDYIIRNNNKIVITIDNLERCNKDNILFIVDAINNILNFKNTIYILSYDEEQMRKVFETDINVDYSYLEKIIQIEYYVPVISEEAMQDVLNTCIKNYITYSKGDIDEESIANVTLMIGKCVGNLREFKRILNSVFTYNLTISKYLNNIDMILIEVIHFKNPEL